MPAHANQRDEGPGRLKRVEPRGKLTKSVRGFGDVRTAEGIPLGMIGGSYPLVSAKSSRRGQPAAWIGRGLCAELQPWHILVSSTQSLALIGHRDKFGKTHPREFPVDNKTECMKLPDDSLCFNDLRFVVHDKA